MRITTLLKIGCKESEAMFQDLLFGEPKTDNEVNNKREKNVYLYFMCLPLPHLIRLTSYRKTGHFAFEQVEGDLY